MASNTLWSNKKSIIWLVIIGWGLTDRKGNDYSLPIQLEYGIRCIIVVLECDLFIQVKTFIFVFIRLESELVITLWGKCALME